MFVKNYYDILTDDQMKEVDEIERNPERTRSMLRTYARHISSFASYLTMLNDMKTSDVNISENTFLSYVNVFEELYIIENTKA